MLTSAMNAPMCNICDPPRRHWLNEPHVVRKVPSTVAPQRVMPFDADVERVEPVAGGGSVEAAPAPIPKAKADRVEYMRAYMAKRRAEKAKT